MKAWRGFSLIEVMIVVVILAVLIALAVPTFLEASLSSKLSSHANSLVASAHLARGEAIKRNSEITMCVSTDGADCASGSWEQGWIVMCPTTDGALCDPAGVDVLVLQYQQAMPSGYKIIEFSSDPPLETLTFKPTGVGSTAAEFTVCRAEPTVGSQERIVRFGITGSPSVTTPDAAGSCT